MNKVKLLKCTDCAQVFEFNKYPICNPCRKAKYERVCTVCSSTYSVQKKIYENRGKYRKYQCGANKGAVISKEDREIKCGPCATYDRIMLHCEVCDVSHPVKKGAGTYRCYKCFRYNDPCYSPKDVPSDENVYDSHIFKTTWRS